MTNKDMTPKQMPSPVDPMEQMIEIVVPVNYLRGSLTFSMKYIINPGPYCNNVGNIKVIPHCDNPEEPVFSDIIYPDDLIIMNINRTLQYFQLVKKFLDVQNKKRTPPTFEEFIKDGKEIFK